ncbi:uncharacterized protein LOC135501857 isoform X2 [Lineus longissimus]|uniref:uncharacterized protein LOC135501857 isoform X2 n=1 Tax=Lineus longissimus TaxID=88925 RepID=UPI00315C9781
MDSAEEVMDSASATSDVDSATEVSEVEEDLKELKLFLGQAQRPRVKELLQDDIKKLESEASAAAAASKAPEMPVVREETVASAPQQKRLPTKKLDTYGRVQATVASPQPLPEVPLGKFLIKMNLLGTNKDICVLVKEEHRDKLMEHTQTICSGLAKYVQDNGVPDDPLHLDLDSFTARDVKQPLMPIITSIGEPNEMTPARVTSNDASDEMEYTVNSTVVRRHIWSKAHTRKMFELFKAFEQNLDGRKKKYPIWQVIATELKKQFKIDVNANQCVQRFKNLKMKCRREIEERDQRLLADEPLGPPTTYHRVMCEILGLEYTPANVQTSTPEVPEEEEEAVLGVQHMSDLENLAEMIPDEGETRAPHSIWSYAEQRKLLQLIKKYKTQFHNGRNHLPIWNMIATELKQTMNSTKEGEQCRAKYKNMKKKFMKTWRARKVQQEAGEPLMETDREYDAMFEICSQDIVVNQKDMNETMALGAGLAGDAVMQTMSITKADGSEEKPVTLPIMKRMVVETPGPGRVKKRDKLQTIQKVQDIINQSDVRLNETLLALHAENKKIMEKLIEKL